MDTSKENKIELNSNARRQANIRNNSVYTTKRVGFDDGGLKVWGYIKRCKKFYVI